MFQSILVGSLLLGAAIYLGRLIYRSFTVSSCESGCGKCATLDVNSILKSIDKKKASA
ncbi:MAG: hypothetical protein RIA63_07180 [Cyclobacteriaceae bacterium]